MGDIGSDTAIIAVASHITQLLLAASQYSEWLSVSAECRCCGEVGVFGSSVDAHPCNANSESASASHKAREGLVHLCRPPYCPIRREKWSIINDASTKCD
jgi:hypothetical protein